MSTSSLPAGPLSTPSELDVEHHLPSGWGEGMAGRWLYFIALAFALFQVATALYAFLPSQVLRSVHVGFLILTASALLANHRHRSPIGLLGGWAMGIVGFLVGLYHWIFYQDLVIRAGELMPLDMVTGVVSLVVLFVVAWRLMGPALPLICLFFLAYALFGQYFPRPLNTRGYSFEQVIEHMAFGTEGIYAVPTAVSATFIFLFILFGAFLERAGMIQLFNDFSMGLVGHKRGGAAKVSVISSALMGTISGSGVANVVTTGQFTIPLMKRFGYKATFAGGVEATASMGGQIMPPVMGAVAFIMAENIGIPYVEIAKAAVLPALLYFASAFWMVHLEAGKYHLKGLPRHELPNPLQALKKQWHLVLPLAILVYLLMDGFTPLFSGSVGLALTVLLILGTALVQGHTQIFRVVFWVILGLFAASFLWWGVFVLVALVALMLVACLFREGGRATLVLCRDALADGARQALPVGLACAIVGVVIGTMTLTGAASTFGQFVVSFGQHSLFLSLVLVMLTCIILGTGLPTIPTYIITASIAAPALLKLGVPLLVSHMFVFYYGILADLTPPVALAALAAAPIAKASPDAIGWQATRIALAGFLIPFLCVYEPVLMLQDASWLGQTYGYGVELAWVLVKTSAAIVWLGVASIGYFHHAPTPIWGRALFGLSALLLITPYVWGDALGLVLGTCVSLWHVTRSQPA